ncbi:hypothetical protein BP6252_06394 [Coleophoma cylindrospora]|uniref:Uncharacterized protein n=1 Tax=Coleophoma cylindrospora TaxID=1849047 RepID=A0A3D8RME1_9HELO|nr:hypothetical protein BP6252_06394 [Coleophoma cylindrospora]
MSPAATDGFPSRATTTVSKGGPVTSTVINNGMKQNGLDGLRGLNRVFPHIDDLTSAKPDINVHAPIRKILQDGELFAKQADTHLDFRRPDVALQEYMKASIVATDIIPRHKDYPSLQADRGDLHRLYTALKKRINNQHQKFIEVKELIKENNAKNGVQPIALRGTGSGAVDSLVDKTHIRSQSAQTSASNGSNSTLSPGTRDTESLKSPLTSMSVSPRNSIEPRRKPPVVPKPNALHGNAIQPLVVKSKDESPIDLAARFARLRASENSTPVQDPRIRTRPITIPGSLNTPVASEQKAQDPAVPTKPVARPSGPREMPTVPSGPIRSMKMNLPINVDVPTMPRAPDAIYSPASIRSADGTPNPNLPFSATKRTSHIRTSSRQNSISSLSKVARTPASVEEGREYFSMVPAAEPANSFMPAKRISQEPNLPPESTTVTPGELMSWIGRHRILLVDIRSREEFDEGHIMSQYIICIEPDILTDGMSAEQLEERIVLSPDAEQELYAQRNEFDLVVYYNQSSTGIDSDGDVVNRPMEYFRRAVFEFAYNKQLKHKPLLLYGGLDAWIDLLGPASLQSSELRVAPRQTLVNGIKPARPLGRFPRDNRRLAQERRKTYESRPLTTEEEKNWDKVLRETPEDAYYVRTPEEFFRKYPEVSLQESMVAPSRSNQQFQQAEDAHQRELASTMPPPPARPAPALPRQSFSGISEKASTGGPLLATQNGPSGKIESISEHQVRPGHTGLHNFGNTCYMNAAIQCLSVTAPVRNFLVNYQYPSQMPPRKEGETTDPPQLMVRNVGNLFRYLWNGQYAHITPKTFRDYVYRLHSMRGQRHQAESFGGPSQQDSAEFLEFILDILSDELNPLRNRAFPRDLTTAEEQKRAKMSALSCAREDWEKYRSHEGSLITEHMQGMWLTTTRCENCHYVSRRSSPFTNISVAIIPRGTESLTDALERQYNRTETLDDYKCDQCKVKKAATTQQQLARLPEYLVIQLNRFASQEGLAKIKTTITFPVGSQQPLDMTPYTIPAEPEEMNSPDLDDGFKGPFIYHCYATIHHIGNALSAGHYIAVTQNGEDKTGKKEWWVFNDTRLSKATIADIKSANTYVLFYKRTRAPK